MCTEYPASLLSKHPSSSKTGPNIIKNDIKKKFEKVQTS